MAGLTLKQKAFADYFVELANATEAYKKAGYSYKSDQVAGVEGHKLTRNPKIRAYIDELVASKDKARIASQDEVLEFLTAVMRGDITEKIPVLIGGGMQKLMENKPAAQVRKSAAELLGKRYRLFTDNVNVSGEMGVKIINDIPKPK